MDGILKTNLDNYFIRAVKNNFDGIGIISGGEGCLVEDTIILCMDDKKKLSDCSEYEIVKAYDFKNKKIVDAWAKVINSGIKDVYELELESGKKVQASADHKFFVKHKNKINEIELKEIKTNNILFLFKDNEYTEKIKSIRYIGKKQTYDLKVPLYHNFVLANGIITHNSGKTSLSSAIAYYCDPSFPGENCERIVFSNSQIMSAIDKAKKGQAILIDEAILSMGSQDHATDIQKILIKKFVTIRKKNLYIFIVIPSFFMLRKYFAIFRTRFLIHIYTPDGVTRGFFSLFNRARKRQLYIRGIKEMDMGIVRPNYKGRFTDTYGFFYNPEVYEKKKDQAIADLSDDPSLKYKIQLKERYDKAISDLQDWKANMRQKYTDLLKTEKDKFNTKLIEITEKNKVCVQDLKQKVKLVKTGKVEDEIRELVDFRDKLLYSIFKDDNPVKVCNDLREKGIIVYTPQAIKVYMERGKNLLEIEKS